MASLQYKIIEITPNSIQVLYFEEQESDGIFINLGTTPYPKTEQELLDRINQQAPYSYFEQKKVPLNNMSHLVGLAGVTGHTAHTAATQAPASDSPANRFVTFEDL